MGSLLARAHKKPHIFLYCVGFLLQLLLGLYEAVNSFLLQSKWDYRLGKEACVPCSVHFPLCRNIIWVIFSVDEKKERKRDIWQLPTVRKGEWLQQMLNCH